MTHKNISVKEVAYGLSNYMYANNLQATKELMELFDYIKTEKLCSKFEYSRLLETAEDYIRLYDESFYTYITWEGLVESEAKQNEPLTEEECKELINITIFRLPCGWYVQYV